MIEFIGYMGSIAAASCSLPQLIKMFRTKHVRDISIWWGILLGFANICWITYGISHGLMPVIACNSVILVQAVLLVIFKIRWSSRN